MNKESQNSIIAVCLAVFAVFAVASISSCAESVSKDTTRAIVACAEAGNTWTTVEQCIQ